MGGIAAQSYGARREPVPQEVLDALPPGTLIDHYLIEKVIGAGGFAITYRGLHRGLNKVFAIKEHFPRTHAYRDPQSMAVVPMAPGDPTFEWARDRFIDEARTLARFRHKAIVAVASVFEANGTAYSVLEYEDGRTLFDWLDEIRRKPNQAELDYIIAPLLEALEIVHSSSYLHRDISPDNIMLRPDGSPCLLDFGSAREAIGRETTSLTAIVKSGFSPPEQYLSEGRGQGPWTDIYALAATLFLAVTGDRPPEATERMLDPSTTPLASKVAGRQYRQAFLAAIDWGLGLRPEDRPENVAQWRMALYASDIAATPVAASAQAAEFSATGHLATEGTQGYLSTPDAPSELPHAPAQAAAPEIAPPAEAPAALLMDGGGEVDVLSGRIALAMAIAAIPAVLAAAFVFHSLRWGLVLSAAQTGLTAGAVLLLGSATAILIHRDASVRPLELALYWWTIAVLLALLLGLLFAHLGLAFFKTADPLQGELLSGWIVGLALLVLSSMFLIGRRGRHATKAETIVFASAWFVGCGWTTAFALHAIRIPQQADMVGLMALGSLGASIATLLLLSLSRLVIRLADRRSHPAAGFLSIGGS